MERWREVWREGLAPQLSVRALEALRLALVENDPRLVQGSTVLPAAVPDNEALPVEAACAISFCAWQGEGLSTVGEVERFFARTCWEADQRLRDVAVIRWFLGFADEVSRHEMRRQLLAEVQRALAQRRADGQEGPAPVAG